MNPPGKLVAAMTVPRYRLCNGVARERLCDAFGPEFLGLRQLTLTIALALHQGKCVEMYRTAEGHPVTIIV